MDGSTLGDVFDMKGRGKAAIVRDPQAAMFGIIKTDHGDPEPQTGVGEFIWTELWAEDPAAVSRFYSGRVVLTYGGHYSGTGSHACHRPDRARSPAL